MKTNKIALFILFILLTGYLFAQADGFNLRFNNGLAFYNHSRFYEAASEFRRAQEMAVTENDWAGALYWVILSQLAYTDYGSALIDMNELERKAPTSIYNRDMTYHRARIYYNQGYFENALILFRRYIDSITTPEGEAEHRKAAAFFWMGECLFAMGQFDEAERFYFYVLSSFPQSPKRETASYRIDLIKQKKIESELLALLQWSHEEALRTSEDYQRRMRTYEFTINAYQRRIAELSQRQNIQDRSIPESDTESHPIISEEFVDQPFEEFLSDVTQEYHEELIEKARQLGDEIQRLINNSSNGETW